MEKTCEVECDTVCLHELSELVFFLYIHRFVLQNSLKQLKYVKIVELMDVFLRGLKLKMSINGKCSQISSCFHLDSRKP